VQCNLGTSQSQQRLRDLSPFPQSLVAAAIPCIAFNALNRQVCHCTSLPGVLITNSCVVGSYVAVVSMPITLLPWPSCEFVKTSVRVTIMPTLLTQCTMCAHVWETLLQVVNAKAPGDNCHATEGAGLQIVTGIPIVNKFNQYGTERHKHEQRMRVLCCYHIYTMHGSWALPESKMSA
jgi:hypothetical protein